MLLTIITLTIVYVLPLKETLRALRQEKDASRRKWPIYWMMVAVFHALRMVLSVGLGGEGLWKVAEIVFCLWGYHPSTEGWAYVDGKLEASLQKYGPSVGAL